jgi:hypothetical protein
MACLVDEHTPLCIRNDYSRTTGNSEVNLYLAPSLMLEIKLTIRSQSLASTRAECWSPQERFKPDMIL